MCRQTIRDIWNLQTWVRATRPLWTDAEWRRFESGCPAPPPARRFSYLQWRLLVRLSTFASLSIRTQSRFESGCPAPRPRAAAPRRVGRLDATRPASSRRRSVSGCPAPAGRRPPPPPLPTPVRVGRFVRPVKRRVERFVRPVKRRVGRFVRPVKASDPTRRPLGRWAGLPAEGQDGFGGVLTRRRVSARPACAGWRRFESGWLLGG